MSRINIITTLKDKEKHKKKNDNLITELRGLLYDDVPSFVQKEKTKDILTAIIRIININGGS